MHNYEAQKALVVCSRDTSHHSTSFHSSAAVASAMWLPHIWLVHWSWSGTAFISPNSHCREVKGYVGNSIIPLWDLYWTPSVIRIFNGVSFRLDFSRHMYWASADFLKLCCRLPFEILHWQRCEKFRHAFLVFCNILLLVLVDVRGCPRCILLDSVLLF